MLIFRMKSWNLFFKQFSNKKNQFLLYFFKKISFKNMNDENILVVKMVIDIIGFVK